jgi:hypothetical protein
LRRFLRFEGLWGEYLGMEMDGDRKVVGRRGGEVRRIGRLIGRRWLEDGRWKRGNLMLLVVDKD